MVSEVDFLSFLPGSVLYVEDADEVSGPAAHQSVEELEENAAEHSQLRERVRQRQQHLRHLRKRSPSRDLEREDVHMRKREREI